MRRFGLKRRSDWNRPIPKLTRAARHAPRARVRALERHAPHGERHGEQARALVAPFFERHAALDVRAVDDVAAQEAHVRLHRSFFAPAAAPSGRSSTPRHDTPSRRAAELRRESGRRDRARSPPRSKENREASPASRRSCRGSFRARL